jgi:hypothetical protein
MSPSGLLTSSVEKKHKQLRFEMTTTCGGIHMTSEMVVLLTSLQTQALHWQQTVSVGCSLME